jgi:hypothetical protein
MMKTEDIKHGDLLELKGKTNHGKNRINQHGSTWMVNTQWDGNNFHGGKIMLESLNETFGGFADGRKVKDGRWISVTNDPNFDVKLHTREGTILWEK